MSKNTPPPASQHTQAVKILMSLSKEAHDRCREIVHILWPTWNETLIRPGDTLCLDYEVSVYYFNDLIKKLTAVQTLCADPEVNVEVSREELEEVRILVYEVLKRLENVIQEVRSRDES